MAQWLERDRRELSAAVKAAVRRHVQRIVAANADWYGYALLPGEPYEVESLVGTWNRERDVKENTIEYRYSSCTRTVERLNAPSVVRAFMKVFA